MIVLDTNIISAAISNDPRDLPVRKWLNTQVEAYLYVTSLSIHENFYGVEMMADGKRKQALLSAYQAIYDKFERRVLNFDSDAAITFSREVSKAQKTGSNLGLVDCMIASIAMSNSMLVATRDVTPFNILMPGKVINPWDLS